MTAALRSLPTGRGEPMPSPKSKSRGRSTSSSTAIWCATSIRIALTPRSMLLTASTLRPPRGRPLIRNPNFPEGLLDPGPSSPDHAGEEENDQDDDKDAANAEAVIPVGPAAVEHTSTSKQQDQHDKNEEQAHLLVSAFESTPRIILADNGVRAVRGLCAGALCVQDCRPTRLL